jgi:hypothetical protein
MAQGLEYLITPPGLALNSWADTPIGVPDPTILNNFRAQVRYYEDTTDPTTGLSTRTYPGFIVVSQTLNAVSPNGGDLFHEGETYPASPTFTATGTVAINGYATAGITDGAAYAYSKVFDQTEFRIIEIDYIPPKAPPAVDGSVEVDNIPTEPYDPSNDIYPYDAITNYNPDPRNAVTVTYTLSTTYSLSVGGPTATDQINIIQIVTQTIDDWSDACKDYVSKGAFTNGLYNTEVQ